MKCRNCGAEAIEGDIFCGECGKALVSEEPRKEKSSIRNKLIIFVVIGIIGVLLFVYWTYWPKESEPPRLSASPEPLSFNLGSMGAGETASKTLSISNAGGGTLTWSVSDDQPWIDVSPTSGTNSGDVTISINTTGLRQGSYSGTITIISNGEEKRGSVSLDITAAPTPTTPTPTTPTPTPVLSVSPDPPSFNLGTVCVGESKSSQLSISNSGSGTLTWSISADKPWITVGPVSGTDSGTVTVSINAAGMNSGSNSGAININSNGGTKTGSLSLNIMKPQLSVSPDPPSFNLGKMNAGDSISKTLSISNSGCGTLTWSISGNQPWITVNPASGTNSGTVTISINTAGLSPGNYTGTITVTSDVRSESVTVAFTIPMPPTVSINFDTLPDGTPITTERILNGNEFLAKGINVAGAPESAYCANATSAAIRLPGTYGGTTFNFLTTSRPNAINYCNGIPVAISFTNPVRLVTLTFAGASVTYTMKVYDTGGNLLGTSQKDAVFGSGPFQITYSSASANIKRITFGYETAITAIKEIYYER